MVEVTDQLLSEMVDAIVWEVDPERIILFGSYASGSAAPESDLDLLIVESQPFGQSRSRWAEITRIRRALSAFRVPKDVLVYSADEFVKWRHARNHVISRCLRDGKTLYERP